MLFQLNICIRNTPNIPERVINMNKIIKHNLLCLKCVSLTKSCILLIIIGVNCPVLSKFQSQNTKSLKNMPVIMYERQVS